MSDYLKKKTISNFTGLVAAGIALVLTVIYGVFTSKYGLLNNWAVVCMVAAIILNLALFALDTPIDEYLKVIVTVLTALALAFFVAACVGDIFDFLNQSTLMGTGAPFQYICAIAVGFVVLVLVQVVNCFMSKKAK